MSTSFKSILNPVFIACLVALILNDLVLKAAFPGFVTGKLSDMAGIIVFASFFQAILGDRLKLYIYLVTAIAFALWKTELSQGLIDLWNANISLIHFGRTVDYADIACVAGLIPLYFYKPEPVQFRFRKEIVLYPLLGFSLMAIVATSRVRNFETYDANDLAVDVFKKVTVHLSKEEFLKKLAENAVGEQDTIPAASSFIYSIQGLKLDNDTLSDLNLWVKSKRNKVKVEVCALQVQNYWKKYTGGNAKANPKKLYQERIISYLKNLD